MESDTAVDSGRMVIVHICEQCGRSFAHNSVLSRAKCPHCEHEFMSHGKRQMSETEARELGVNLDLVTNGR